MTSTRTRTEGKAHKAIFTDDDTEITQILEEKVEKEEELYNALAKLNNLEAHMEKVLNSYSWRLTKPLRKLAQLLRFLKKGFRKIKLRMMRVFIKTGEGTLAHKHRFSLSKWLLAYKIINRLGKHPAGGAVVFRPKNHWCMVPPATRNRLAQCLLPQGFKTDTEMDILLSAKEGDYIYERFDWTVSLRRQSVSTYYQDSVWPFCDNVLERALPDVLVFCVIDWDFRIQRPQHMARKLAEKGHRVFYISNNFIDSQQSFFRIKPIIENLPLYHVSLALANAPSIYTGVMGDGERKQLARGLAALLYQAGYNKRLCLLQHPYWTELAFTITNSQIIYDCMDEHAGFENTAASIIEKEKILFEKSDMVIASAQALYNKIKSYTPSVSLIRNATDYAHFSKKPDKIYQDKEQRKIIGYYGAIAQWFDEAIVVALAEAFKDTLILLIGADTAEVKKKLYHYSNVIFTGEVSYETLPYYLYAFDVCIIPFKQIPLTEATNPVKVYEYLSAGKPVVSVNLPELRAMQDYVLLADTVPEFVSQVESVLTEDPLSEKIAARKKFASVQTWTSRIDALTQALDALPSPLVSIIVLTYNNLALTKACLDSIVRHTDYPNYEVIIVDNASADDTPAYLTAHYADKPHFRILLNNENTGFAAGNNIGLKTAKGEYLVILNNDTEVTPGWLQTMVNYFKRHPDIGILGPVTNNIGNEAKVPTTYKSPRHMLPETLDITLQHMGELRLLHTAAFFCVMLSREVFEKVGLLDEAFGVGFFEDDDYCRRVQAQGYRVYCAKDVFVHHHLSASFGKMKRSRKRMLFEKNRAIYEKKWGPWQPHRHE